MTNERAREILMKVSDVATDDDNALDAARVWLASAEFLTDEAKELLRECSELPAGRYPMAAVDAYRDSLTPAVVVPDGWEEDGERYVKGSNAAVYPGPGGGRWLFRIAESSGDECRGARDTLPEAFTAADNMLERLGLVAPDTATTEDPNPWRKTDGMVPPKEAGDRVIETVDGSGAVIFNAATSSAHAWACSDTIFRPIKWRYADGD